MKTLTDKWQCVKCKELKIKTVAIIETESGMESIDPNSLPDIMCHSHMMRNLTEDQYLNEKALNDSGARDENAYRI